MKTRTVKTSKFIALIASVIIAVSIIPAAVFAQEETSGDTVHTISAPASESTSTCGTEANTEANTEESNTEESGIEATVEAAAEENGTDTEKIAAEEQTEQVITETQEEEAIVTEEPAAEEIAQEETEIPPTFYNAICISGVTAPEVSGEQFAVSVTNTRTGELQEGCMSLNSNGALAGHLTTGGFTDASGFYKIEVRVCGEQGEMAIAYGTSIGSAASASGYATISFMVD